MLHLCSASVLIEPVITPSPACVSTGYALFQSTSLGHTHTHTLPHPVAVEHKFILRSPGQLCPRAKRHHLR